MDNITGMSIQEYAAMRELECEHKKGWGSTTALWVIAAVIVIAFLFIAGIIAATSVLSLRLVWLT